MYNPMTDKIEEHERESIIKRLNNKGGEQQHD